MRSLSFTMFTETDWLISLDHESFNQHRRYFTHVTHHCLYDAAGDPLPSFPKVGWRKLWRKTLRAILYQGCRESIVRFLIETIVCIINAFKARSSAFESRQKLPRVYHSYRESSQHLWRHFLHYDIIPLKVPFRLTGHIYFFSFWNIFFRFKIYFFRFKIYFPF